MRERKKGQKEKEKQVANEKKEGLRDRGEELEKEKRGSREAERTSLHSLLIRAIGQQHDTHLQERMRAVAQTVHPHLGAHLARGTHTLEDSSS